MSICIVLYVSIQWIGREVVQILEVIVDVLDLPLNREIVLVLYCRILTPLEYVRLQITVRYSFHMCEPLVSTAFVDRENEYDVMV